MMMLGSGRLRELGAAVVFGCRESQVRGGKEGCESCMMLR